jgi:hypothetical protein
MSPSRERIGDVEMFPQAMLRIQIIEHEWPTSIRCRA